MWTTAERSTTISPTPPSTPRLHLLAPRSAGEPRTLLDGGWWPRSADPVAELPGLILALDARHCPITRVLLRKADWDSHPRRLGVDDPGSGGTTGRVVRLGWFDTMPAGLLIALCVDARRVDLITVPAHAHHADASAIMELAADPHNHLRTPALLSALTPPSTRTAHLDAATALRGLGNRNAHGPATTPPIRTRAAPGPEQPVDPAPIS
jgi:hypothetical protein